MSETMSNQEYTKWTTIVSWILVRKDTPGALMDNEKMWPGQTNEHWAIRFIQTDKAWNDTDPWETPSNKMQAYYETDATYDIEYYCEAAYDTALSTAAWRIFRVRTTTATTKFYDKTWAWIAFNKAATNLATVKAYTYN